MQFCLALNTIFNPIIQCSKGMFTAKICHLFTVCEVNANTILFLKNVSRIPKYIQKLECSFQTLFEK